MKRKTTVPNLSPRRMLAASILILGFAAPTVMATPWWMWSRSPSKKQADLAYQAELSSAMSDYLLGMAKSESLVNGREKKGAKQEVAERYRESLEECRRIYKARLLLTNTLREYRYCPQIDPAAFSSPEEAAANPNQYWRLVPGTILTYHSETEDGTEVIQVEVTDEVREILGIQCTVVVETVWLDGELTEDAEDWYAQDKEGNVWCFGEFSLEYEDGELTGTAGTWEAGKQGAKPGIQIHAQPKVSTIYRQELLLGEAEDVGTVLSTGETVRTGAGTFRHCVKTADTTPLEPEELEHEYYAPGVGMVLEVDPESGETVELVSMQQAP